MCGIAGTIGSYTDNNDSVRRMLSAIEHRGPDSSGVWTDQDNNVSLGHNRLAIVDLSDAGQQPMMSHDERYVIVFNGEIYNHDDIRKKMDARIQWRGHSDTETLLTAIQYFGIGKALEMSVGMFAFAIWDREKRMLTLARDRAGEKPLYFGSQNGVFYFASEISSIAAHSAFKRNIDRTALAMMLQVKHVPAPYSIFNNIQKLIPGHLVNVSGKQDISEQKCYWDATKLFVDAKQSKLSQSSSTTQSELESLIQSSVSQQLMADVPLGAFLSGGVDSSLVVALMQKASTGKVRTFSIGFEDRRYNEAQYAASVAKHLGTDHTEQIVTSDDIRNVIPLLPSIYSEPFSDASQIPTFLVSKLARQSVTVALSGDGGDELFGGYNRYHETLSRWAHINRLPVHLRSMAARIFKLLPAGPVNRLGSAVLKPRQGRATDQYLGDRLLKGFDLLDSEYFDDFYFRNFAQWKSISELVPDIQGQEIEILNNMHQCSQSSKLEQMMLKDFNFYLPNDILTKVDRAAMAVSLETRVPLLDHRIVEYSWRIPTDSYMSTGPSKQTLKKILFQYVPRELIERPKRGFGVPMSEWLKGPLKEWMLDTLNSDRLRSDGFVNADTVERRVQEHLKGSRQWSESLWSLLMFQTWYDSTR